MPNCQKYDMQLSAYLDGELSPKERKQVEQHLNTCADCRRYAALLQSIRKELREPLPEPPETLATGILYKIGLEKTQRRRRYLRYGRWTAVAAVLCLAIFGVVHMSGTNLTKETAADAVSLRSTVSGAAAGKAADTDGYESEPMAKTESVMDMDAYDNGQTDYDYAAGANSYMDTLPAEAKLAKANTAELPGYNIAIHEMESGSFYSVCFFYYALDSGIGTEGWEQISAPEGQQRWLAPAEDLQALEVESACDEIYYGDMAAENSLVVVLTEMEGK